MQIVNGSIIIAAADSISFRHPALLEKYVAEVSSALKEKKIWVIRNIDHKRQGRPAAPGTIYVAFHPDDGSTFVTFGKGRGEKTIIYEVGITPKGKMYAFSCPGDSYREGMHLPPKVVASLPSVDKVATELNKQYERYYSD